MTLTARTLFHYRSLKTRIALATLAIFLASLWALSFYSSHMLRIDMERMLGQQQLSTVTYVAAQLDGELNERIKALEMIARATDPARFLAKRFAAKEALGKALGIGVAKPATLPNIAVEHDALGKPSFSYAPELAQLLAERGLVAHLSISDEKEFALAFVVLEHA